MDTKTREGGADVRDPSRLLDLYSEVCAISSALVAMHRGETVEGLPEAEWDGWANVFMDKLDARLQEIREWGEP